MSSNLARRNRRAPVLCILLLLFSTIITAFGTLIYALAENAWLWKGFQFNALYIIPQMLYNVVSFSVVFLLLLAFVLCFKPKGWVISILSFTASAFMLVVGLLIAIPGVSESVDSIIEWVNNSDFVGLPSIVTLITFVLEIIFALLPLISSVCWFSLGLSGVLSSLQHRSERKGLRGFLATLSVTFGIFASSLFIISSFGNTVILIEEIVSICVRIFAQVNEPSIYTMLIAFIPFTVANFFGAVGTVLLSAYLVSPFKRGYKPQETDPLIVYAIDEDDPVMCEIDGGAQNTEEVAPEKATEAIAEDVPKAEESPEELAEEITEEATEVEGDAATEEATEVEGDAATEEAIEVEGDAATEEATVPTEEPPEEPTEEVSMAEESAATYCETREEEAKRAAAYIEEMHKVKERELKDEKIHEEAVKKATKRWTPILIISFVTLLASLVFEPGLLISTTAGIIGLAVILFAKKKTPIIVLAIINMVLGGGLLSIAAGILMIFIPADSLIQKNS